MGLLSGKKFVSTIGMIEDLTALILSGVLAYVFFKYANKWTAKKTENLEIDEIGKQSKE